MIRKEKQAQRRRGGFTLLEILVVVAIIVALAGVGGVFVIGQLNRSKISTAQIQIQNLSSAVQTFYVNEHRYPNTLDELLASNPPVIDNASALTDPWGQPYDYKQSGPRYNGLKPDISTTVPGTSQVIGN